MRYTFLLLLLLCFLPGPAIFSQPASLPPELDETDSDGNGLPDFLDEVIKNTSELLEPFDNFSSESVEKYPDGFSIYLLHLPCRHKILGLFLIVQIQQDGYWTEDCPFIATSEPFVNGFAYVRTDNQLLFYRLKPDEQSSFRKVCPGSKYCRPCSPSEDSNCIYPDGLERELRKKLLPFGISPEPPTPEEQDDSPFNG